MAMAFSIDLRAALFKLFPDAFIRMLAKSPGAVKRLPCLLIPYSASGRSTASCSFGSRAARCTPPTARTATKLAWLLDRVPGARARAEREELEYLSPYSLAAERGSQRPHPCFPISNVQLSLGLDSG